MQKLILICIIAFSVSCNANKEDNSDIETDTTYIDVIDSNMSIIDTIEIKRNSDLVNNSYDVLISELKSRADTSNLHSWFYFNDWQQRKLYFFAGYNEYDEDKYGFQNPAYLKVFLDSQLIYKSDFRAYDDLDVKYIDIPDFEMDIDFYIFSWGIKADDYIYHQSLLYRIDSSILYLDEFVFQYTNYASRYTEFIWPSDSSGIPSKLITIDKIDYWSDEELDKADTTIYSLIEKKFIIEL